jgi:hypothetical protein
MENIIPRLFVGSDKDYERFEGHAGWSFLRPIKDGPGGHRQTLGYTSLAAPHDKNYLWIRDKKNHLALNLIDVDDPEFISDDMLDVGIRFIKERLDVGDKVLVACNAGHSRSTTITLMFLRTQDEMPDSFLASEKKFRGIYHLYDPSRGMRAHAKRRWQDLPNFFKE